LRPFFRENQPVLFAFFAANQMNSSSLFWPKFSASLHHRQQHERHSHAEQREPEAAWFCSGKSIVFVGSGRCTELSSQHKDSLPPPMMRKHLGTIQQFDTVIGRLCANPLRLAIMGVQIKPQHTAVECKLCFMCLSR